MNWQPPINLTFWRRPKQLERRSLACVHSAQPCRCGRRLLSDCRFGQVVEVQSVQPELGCAQRLRELGILEGASLQLMRGQDPLLVLVKDSRIAIDLHAAKHIVVRVSESHP